MKLEPQRAKSEWPRPRVPGLRVECIDENYTLSTHFSYTLILPTQKNVNIFKKTPFSHILWHGWIQHPFLCVHTSTQLCLFKPPFPHVNLDELLTPPFPKAAPGGPKPTWQATVLVFYLALFQINGKAPDSQVIMQSWKAARLILM